MDAAIFAALMVAGIIVVVLRGQRAITLLKANGPILLYLLYCVISVSWSPFPEPAFKRWTKDVGDVVMVLILATDAQPIAALRRLYSRLGFILFPASILLIRYTELGRGYDPDGRPMNTGVKTNKNSFGIVVFFVSLGVLWNLRALLAIGGSNVAGAWSPRPLLTGIVLLQMAHSATSVACFILGAGLMFATNLRSIRIRPGRVHALCLVIILAGGLLLLFGGQVMVSNALGRGDKLSGRTDIWAAAIAESGNPIIGTGFESFWNANARKVSRTLIRRGFLDMPDLVSAHNGYIEVYLDLGWAGVSLIALILISGYRHASKAFQRDPKLGSLMLAYIATGTFYSITEVGFRVLTPSWIFLLLAVVTSSGVAAGFLGGEAPEILVSRSGTANRTPANNKLIPARKTAYAERRGFTDFEMTRADNLR